MTRRSLVLSAPVQPLWITDALLADAFHRFACSHSTRRRHGSNVPGPLEARRRATKRKNTSWAQLGSHTPSAIDPALLLHGEQNQKAPQWWQGFGGKQGNNNHDNARAADAASQGNESATKPPPSLLDWLLPPAEPPQTAPRSPSFLDLSSHDDGNIPPTRPPYPPTREGKTFDVQSFRARLRHSRHVHEMREALEDLELGYDQKLAAIKIVLAHILALASPAREIADFLTEPCFNLPETEHHVDLLRQLKPNRELGQNVGEEEKETDDANAARLREYFTVPQNWQTLHKGLCRAAELGLIRPGSFQQAMDHLYGYPDGSADEKGREGVHGEAREFLANFEESRLFELRDLSQDWACGFVDKILSEPLTAASWQLLLAFRDEDEVLGMIQDSRLPRLTTSGVDGAVAFFQNLSESKLCEVQHSLQRRRPGPFSTQVLLRLLPEGEFVEWLKGRIIERMQQQQQQQQQQKQQKQRSIVDDVILLQALPDGILAHLLASVTEEMLVKTWSGDCGPEVMYGWGKVMSSSLNRSTLKQWLLNQDNFEQLMGNAFSSARLGQQERFLVGVWILVKVCWSQAPAAAAAAAASSISQPLALREAFDKLFPALLRAHNFGPEQLKLFTQSLPFEATFVDKLSLLLNSGSGRRPRKAGSESEPMSVAVATLMDDRVYRQLQATSVAGLGALGESVNADLGAFAHISRQLIHGDKYAIRVVKRLLQHNLPLKTSLSQAGPRRMQYSAVGTNVGTSGGTSPAQALGLLERLALAFALAPSLTPRSALVQVHWCYKFLHRYGAPITPAITRALWHAGVTRYNGRSSGGPSYSQVHWILRVVSQVEGHGVAAMLLWNSDFRRRREAILRTVSDELAHEHGHHHHHGDTKKRPGK